LVNRQVQSPLAIERRFGLTGGNIFQGAMTLPHFPDRLDHMARFSLNAVVYMLCDLRG